MRYSTKDYRSLVAAMAVLLIAFGAMGIALADEADGADAGYKVTYTYDGNSIVKTTEDGGQITLAADLDAAFGTGIVKAPTGYEFAGKWSAGSAVYAAGSAVTFVADVTLEPVFELQDAYVAITLVYGDVSEEYVVEGTAITADDIENFAKATGIGLDVTEEGKIVLAKTVTDYALKGFVASDDESDEPTYTTAVADLKAEGGSAASYTLYLTPIYAISVIVDGTTYDAGTSIDPKLPSPSKEGYTLIGWSDGTTVVKPSDEAIAAYAAGLTSDATLKAVWEPAIWSVVLVSEGETVVTETVRNGDLAIRPAAEPIKEGYTFAGWYNGDILYDFAAPVTSDLTLTAAFAEIPATVTYIVDGITVHDPAEPSKYGYTFAGWSDGTTTVATDGLAAYIAALPAASSVTLTAVWTPIYYDVAFVAGEDKTVRSAAYGGQIDAPALPDGYKTWIDAEGFAMSFPYTVEGPATITAVAYEVYTVAFVAGEDTVSTVPVTEGRTVAELPELPEGYSSWAYDGAAITADTTIRAVAIVYWTVTFDYGYTYINDGGFAYRTVQDGQTVTDVPPIPDILGDVRWAYRGEAITADTTVTLEAIPTYVVTFVAGETSIPVTVLEGQAAVAPELPEGYASWQYDGSAVYADTTVEAVPVEAPVYTVTYVIEGKAPVVQMSDSLVVPSTDREGYEFQGWVVSGSSTYIDPLTYAYTQDTTILAVYKAVPVVVPDEPVVPETEDGDDSVLTSVAAIVIAFVVLAVLAIVIVRKGGFAAVKASAKAKKAEKTTRKAAEEAQKKS